MNHAINCPTFVQRPSTRKSLVFSIIIRSSLILEILDCQAVGVPNCPLRLCDFLVSSYSLSFSLSFITFLCTLMDWIASLFYYFLGAFTFIPLVLCLTQFYLALTRTPLSMATEGNALHLPMNDTKSHNYNTKQSWIFLSSTYQPKLTSSAVGQLPGKYGHGYGVLKQGILKIYESEMQRLCKGTLDLNNYEVSLYPSGRKEHILFSRSVALRLVRRKPRPKDDHTAQTTSADTDNELFFSCFRPIDKEDWYFAFLMANNDAPPSTSRHCISFDPIAIASLITFVNKEPDTATNRSIPWFNAILGRTFLGIYKTQRLQHYIFETLSKKTKKMKTTPGFLGDITIRSIDLGHAVPYFTNPTLVALHPDGTLALDMQVNYTGGFKVVVGTTMGVASSPLRVPILLSLTLQSLSSTLRFKIKPPPSNRYWIGFCTMPVMKWSIVPAVSSYNIKLSMVTKIIESKIRRMMMDTMVLPNMEDIPFAKSDGLGGLFFPMDDDNASVTTPDAPTITTNDNTSMDGIGLVTNPVSSVHASASTPTTSRRRWPKLFTSTRRRKNTSPSLSSEEAKTMLDKHLVAKDKDQVSLGGGKKGGCNESGALTLDLLFGNY